MSLIFASVLKKTCGRLFLKSPVCVSTEQSQPIRLASGRSDCDPAGNKPRCTKELLQVSPCMVKKKKDEEMNRTKVFKSIWENPECCKDPCPDVFPRFDELYYKVSDKAKRKYTRTWAECPKWKIVPKVVCNYEQLDFPLPCERRERGDKPKTACIPDGCGKLTKNVKCMKLSLPGCRPARTPPECHIVRLPSDCKKVCAPYPAYSECKKPKQKKRRPIECNCLDLQSQCAMFEYLRSRLLIKSKK